MENTKQILLLVTYKCKPAARERFVDEVTQAGIIRQIALEDGYISYDYYLSAADPDVLLLVEKWSSEKHQQAHLQTEHMNRLKEIKDKYVTDTAVEKILL